MKISTYTKCFITCPNFLTRNALLNNKSNSSKNCNKSTTANEIKNVKLCNRILKYYSAIQYYNVSIFLKNDINCAIFDSLFDRLFD